MTASMLFPNVTYAHPSAETQRDRGVIPGLIERNTDSTAWLKAY